MNVLEEIQEISSFSKMKSKLPKQKKSKNILSSYASCVYSLNDGRLAIGRSYELLIYNMKTYRFDIKIKLIDRQDVKFILQLKDNSLFYYTYDHSSEGPWTDTFYKNYLIELSDKNYVDKTNILPPYSNYNILRELSDNILFGGITYEEESGEYHSTNATGPKRIEKLVKNMEEPGNISDAKDIIKGKFKIDSVININFNDFILPNNNMIAVLTSDKLIFYKSENFEKTNFVKIDYGEKIAKYNENLLLIAAVHVEIFDYKTFKIVKSIYCVYDKIILYVNQNRAFIGETDCWDNRLTEYEIEDNGNYKQISPSIESFKGELSGITIVKDGRLITSTSNNVKIWS